MVQITKCHAFQACVVVRNVETLDDGWCLCVCVGSVRARVCGVCVVCMYLSGMCVWYLSVWCVCVCVCVCLNVRHTFPCFVCRRFSYG